MQSLLISVHWSVSLHNPCPLPSQAPLLPPAPAGHMTGGSAHMTVLVQCPGQVMGYVMGVAGHVTGPVGQVMRYPVSWCPGYLH